MADLEDYGDVFFDMEELEEYFNTAADRESFWTLVDYFMRIIDDKEYEHCFEDAPREDADALREYFYEFFGDFERKSEIYPWIFDIIRRRRDLLDQWLKWYERDKARYLSYNFHYEKGDQFAT